LSVLFYPNRRQSVQVPKLLFGGEASCGVQKIILYFQIRRKVGRNKER
jgi:hypothetical protein